MSKEGGDEAGFDPSGIAKIVQTFARPVLAFLTTALPIVVVNTQLAYAQFQKLPQNVILFVYGTIVCFFGGTFPTLFAALQAAKHGGRQKVMAAVKDLTQEALIIIEESKKDDNVDADKDGKNDVDEISGQELMARKTRLVLQKMNPEKLDRAVGSLYSVWISVVAVLSIQFARTISMSLSIAQFLEKPTKRFIEPVVKAAMPDEYDKWVPVVLSWIIKSIAMSIAWYVQSIISAMSSAMQGGLLMARATFNFCVERDIKIFGEDHTKSNADEYLSYAFAGIGFYTQFRSGFNPPFPLNLILWPFQLAEYYLRWTITNRD